MSADPQCDAASYPEMFERCPFPHIGYVSIAEKPIQALCGYHIFQLAQGKTISISGASPDREGEWINAGADIPELRIRASIGRG